MIDRGVVFGRRRSSIIVVVVIVVDAAAAAGCLGKLKWRSGGGGRARSGDGDNGDVMLMMIYDMMLCGSISS